jgi:hypothetical protein
MSNKLIVFTNIISKKLDIVYNHFQSKFDDIFLISDEDALQVEKKYAILPSFYLDFITNSSVLFLELDDYIEHHSRVTNEIYLVSNLEEITDKKINKSMLKNVKLISIDKNGVIV